MRASNVSPPAGSALPPEASYNALMPRYPARRRTKERARDGRGPLESASFPRIGPDPHEPTVGDFNEPIEFLVKIPAAQVPLRPTKFWFVCVSCRRLPSCGPYTEWITIEIFFAPRVNEAYRNRPGEVSKFSAFATSRCYARTQT